MFNISFSSEIPLYMQIVDETKSFIAAGYFKDGDKLGLIETRPGIGTFIKIDSKKLSSSKNDFERVLVDDFKEAIFLGFSKDEIIGIFDKTERNLYED